jgi:HK97 family phage major capsid protein
MNTLVRIEEARAAWQTAIDHMTEAAARLENAATDADPAVVQALTESFGEAEAEAQRCKENVDRLERIAKARSEVFRAAPESASTSTATESGSTGSTSTNSNVSIRVGKEPLTYERTSSHSFIGDLLAKDTNVNAAERLKRHQYEMAVEMRDISSSATAGGDFIPPVWLNQNWLDVARAGRVTANLVGQRLGAPPAGNSISIPRFATGPDVGIQASDNAAITEVDATTGSLTINVSTIAGQQDISQQLLDRGNPSMDQLIFNSLGQQYALRLNQGVISGAGTGGTIKGLLSATGTTTVTYTDATPTGPELYTVIGQAVSQVETLRFAEPSAIVMHPRRWNWLATQTDTQNRPLVVPVSAYAGMSVEAENPMGVFTVRAQGLAGSMFGLPVFIDPSIPTNLGAGTNEDRILVHG